MPLRAASLCTERKAKLQIVSVFVCSVMVNMPRFFQYNLVTEHNNQNETYVVPKESVIGKRSNFGILYHNVLFTVILFFVPFIILSVLNVKLILRLRGMDSYNLCIRRGRRRFNERNLTLVMIVIIITCLLCHLPERVIQLVKSFLVNDTPSSCNSWFYVQLVSSLLIITNSSTNFLVYYVFRQKFRQHLVLMCCTRCASDDYIEQAYKDNSRTDRRISFRPVSNGIKPLSKDYNLTTKALNVHKQGFNAFLLPMLGHNINNDPPKNGKAFEKDSEIVKFTEQESFRMS